MLSIPHSMCRDILRAVALVTGVSAAVLVVGAVWATSAGATATGSITGTVTDAVSGAPVAGACANVTVSEFYSPAIVACTDATGRYTVSGLGPNTYSVVVVDRAQRHLSSAARIVPVGDGAAVTGVDVALGRGGAISGTVRDAATSAPLAGVCVRVTRVGDNPMGGGTTGDACTDAAGNYQTTGLQSGPYRVDFHDTVGSHLDQYATDRTTAENADLIDVVVGATTSGVDANMVAGASFAGTITDAATGNPVEGICVQLSVSYKFLDGDHCTDSTGRYRTGGLEPGTYSVTFLDPRARYLSNSSSGPVVVTAGAPVPDLDQEMTLGGTISGTVTDATTGSPLAGICVRANGAGAWWACTDSNGKYQVTGLSTDQYALEYTDNLHARYLSRFYSTSATGSVRVPVTAGAVVTDIDVGMQVGARITGTIRRSATSAPVAGACPTAFLDEQTYGIGQARCSAADGTYTIWGLPVGTYRVNFVPPPAANLLGEWYNNRATRDDSDGVTVGSADSVVSGVDASLEDGGIISGRVTATTGGAPLAGICVFATRDGAAALSFAGSEAGSFATCTDSAGNYEIRGAPTGTYRVRFSPPFGSPYLGEWYDDQTASGSATGVKVVAGTATADVNASLTTGGTISGRITAANGGAPIRGACVDVSSNGGLSFASSTTTYYGKACSDSTGNYTLRGVPTGSYLVGFRSSVGNFLPQWFNGKSGSGAADMVQVTNGATTGSIDAALLTGGIVSGTVTADDSDEPLTGACVAVSSSNPYFYGSACTGTDGRYSIDRIPAGSYQVRFSPPNGTAYLPQWHANKTSAATANLVAVSPGSTAGSIDAALVTGGTITGTVRSEKDNSVLVGACVTATRVPPGTLVPYGASDCTGSDGTYEITGLEAGDHLVQFQPAYNTNFIPEFFDNAATVSTATPVAVSLGATRSGLDARLAVGGSITGTVTDRITGDPLPSTYVSVTSVGVGPIWSHWASTDSEGRYAAIGLRAGTYTVGFSSYFSTDPTISYLPQWFDNVATPADANGVTVTAGEATENINARMARGGRITGTVTAASTGQGAASVCVTATRITTPPIVFPPSFSGCTNNSGKYSIGGLADGNYEVRFTPSGGSLLGEWYDGATSAASATPVTVLNGATISNIDASLLAGGSVSGTIRDSATGDPLPNACADVYTASDTSMAVRSACAGADGSYTVGGLPTMSAVVRFRLTPSHVPQWFDGKAAASTATIIAVTSGEDTPAIDASLVRAGTVAGTLTDHATATPLHGACATLYRSNTYEWVTSSCSGTDGRFAIAGLTPGSYRLSFQGPYGSAFKSSWHNGKSEWATADPVTVTGGATTTVDHAFRPIEGISGTVTDAATGLPLQACVSAYSNGSFVSSACSNASGQYAVALSPGTYRLEFRRSGYATQWFKGKADLASADTIVVSAGATTTGRNVQMVVGGTVTGTVTDSATSDPIAGACVYAIPESGTSGFGGSTCADIDGSYSLMLSPGSWKLRFDAPSAGYSQRFWPDSADASGATAVPITAGTTFADIDMSLIKGGAISGKATDADNGAPLSGICVSPIDATGAVVDSRYACTGLDGAYRINGLAPGSYRLSFTNPSGRYLSEWFDDKTSVATATPVVVAGTATSTADAALTLGGSVSGTITDSDTGLPLGGVCVTIVRAGDGEHAGLACTAADGRYRTSGLPTGQYQVLFNDPSARHVTEWWNDQPTRTTATPVAVTVGSDTPGIDAALSPIVSAVSGTVRDDATTPLAGVCAYLYRLDGTYAGFGACTGADGRYEMRGMAAGQYKVGFYDPSALHSTSWHDAKPTHAAGDTVTVVDGTATNGVDGTMPRLTVLSGTIRSTTGLALDGVCAYLFRLDGGYAGAGSCSGADGRYAVQGMPAGDYKVAFFDPSGRHVTAWFNGKATHGAADTVTVVAGRLHSSVDANLSRITSVGGTIRNTTGSPLAGVCAYLYRLDGTYAGFGACSGADGRYLVQNMPAGDYRVGFYDPAGRHVTGWYRSGGSTSSAVTPDEADTVAVASGSSVETIDARLSGIGSITGIVTDPSGAPRTDVCVYADRLDGSYSGIGGCTGADGRYTLNDLPEGGYKLGFYLPDTPTPTNHWYHGAANEASAQRVDVVAGSTTSGIDEQF